MIDEPNSFIPKLRNPDGTVRVHCKICGRFIKNSLYQGFSSVICYTCETGIEVPDYQKQMEDQIFLTDSRDGINPIDKEEKVGLFKSIFRAIGFGRRQRKIDMEKSSPELPSAKTARAKRKRPIFDTPDKEPMD